MNCNKTESELNTKNFEKPQKPIITSKIDSVKFKAEIYRLDTLFQTLCKKNGFNGNVLVAKGNSIIYQKSCGYGVKESNQLLHDSSLFQLASVSKVFTGIGILMLYERGLIKLDDKVSTVLTDFPYKDITVKHLLSHRSGLPNYTYFCSEFSNDCKKEYLSNSEVLDIMIKHKPKPYFNVGLRFNYSNTNYMLLALIIEKVSHKSYSDFMNDEVFIPLGMRNTCTFSTIDSFKQKITQGYTTSFKKVALDKYDGVLGDKGIYTTCYDLFILSTALYQKKILSASTQELAYMPNSPEKKLSNYGLGWRMKNMNSEDKEVFHNGWWHGYRTSFHRRLKDSLTVIVLSNSLNKSVYSTWRIYDAIDGANKLTTITNPDEE